MNVLKFCVPYNQSLADYGQYFFSKYSCMKAGSNVYLQEKIRYLFKVTVF